MVSQEKFIQIAQQDVSYNHHAKIAFHQEGATVLRRLAKLLYADRKEYDIHHNQGGIAVSGEIILHSDTLYIQFCQVAVGLGNCFLWRTCKGRKDYRGGPNRWMPWEKLRDLREVALTMQREVRHGNQQSEMRVE